jgi:hypothetical protein
MYKTIIASVLFSLLIFSCSQNNNTEIMELTNQVPELEKQILLNEFEDLQKDKDAQDKHDAVRIL